eukprot:1367207-Alexandrium_andersonii.AAC.1
MGGALTAGEAPADRLRLLRGPPPSSPGGPSGTPPDMAGWRGAVRHRITAPERWSCLLYTSPSPRD